MKAIIGIFVCLLVSSCGGNNISISDAKEFDVYEFVDYTEDYDIKMFNEDANMVNEGIIYGYRYIVWDSKKINSLKVGDQITFYGFYDDEKIVVVENIEFRTSTVLGEHTKYSIKTGEDIFVTVNGDLYLDYTISGIGYSLTVVNNTYGMILQESNEEPIMDVTPPLGRNVNEIIINTDSDKMEN